MNQGMNEQTSLSNFSPSCDPALCVYYGLRLCTFMAAPHSTEQGRWKRNKAKQNKQKTTCGGGGGGGGGSSSSSSSSSSARQLPRLGTESGDFKPKSTGRPFLSLLILMQICMFFTSTSLPTRGQGRERAQKQDPSSPTADIDRQARTIAKQCEWKSYRNERTKEKQFNRRSRSATFLRLLQLIR